MAKKAKSIYIHLKCSSCRNLNYTTKRPKDTEGKIELMKYCPKERKHTLHKETKV